jgi:hypothetical protein
VFGSHGSGPKGSLIYMGWVWCEGIYSAESLTKLGHYWRRPLTQGLPLVGARAWPSIGATRLSTATATARRAKRITHHALCAELDVRESGVNAGRRDGCTDPRPCHAEVSGLGGAAAMLRRDWCQPKGRFQTTASSGERNYLGGWLRNAQELWNLG